MEIFADVAALFVPRLEAMAPLRPMLLTIPQIVQIVTLKIQDNNINLRLVFFAKQTHTKATLEITTFHMEKIHQVQPTRC